MHKSFSPFSGTYSLTEPPDPVSSRQPLSYPRGTKTSQAHRLMFRKGSLGGEGGAFGDLGPRKTDSDVRSHLTKRIIKDNF